MRCHKYVVEDQALDLLETITNHGASQLRAFLKAGLAPVQFVSVQSQTGVPVQPQTNK